MDSAGCGQETANPVLPHTESTVYNVWCAVRDHNTVCNSSYIRLSMESLLLKIFVAPLRKLETGGTGLVTDLLGALPRVVLKGSKSSRIHTQAAWLQSLCSQSHGRPTHTYLLSARCSQASVWLSPWLSLTEAQADREYAPRR